MELLWLIVKYLGGASIALSGAWFEHRYSKMKKDKTKNKEVMRLFDEQDNCFQQAYLEACIRYAKGEIAEFNLPPSTDVLALALQYDISFFLTIDDFAGQDILPITSWVGSRPIKRP